MPAVTVGNIRITTTFKTGVKYDKSGRMEVDKYMYTSYRNLETGKTATAADLKAAGIKNRQRPAVKLTQENSSYLFNKAQRAEAGEIEAKNFANLLGSKSFGLPTGEQQKQFKDALKNMFKSSNPTDEELAEWNTIVDNLTPEECQEFYQRYQTQLKPGFKGYSSQWSTIGDDDMGRYTGRDLSQVELRSRNASTVRRQILNAGRSFIRDKGRQSVLDEFVKR